MSFDVFFQAFKDGDALDAGGDAAREVLLPYVEREDPEFDFLALRTSDGDADVYLGDGGMLANHVSGVEAWDLLVRAARAADWAIYSQDGPPICLTAEGQREHLPEELRSDVRRVSSGDGLLRAVGASGPKR